MEVAKELINIKQITSIMVALRSATDKPTKKSTCYWACSLGSLVAGMRHVHGDTPAEALALALLEILENRQ